MATSPKISKFNSAFLVTFLCITILREDSEAVDANNFKKCDQSAFCQRLRNFNPEVSPYVADLNSVVVIQNEEISMQLQNTNNGKLFKLQLFLLTDQTIRLKINEAQPLKPRFEVKDVVVKELISEKFTHSVANDTLKVVSNNRQVQISASPFRIDIFDGEEIVFSINSRNHFHIEHLRERNSQNEINSVQSSTTGGIGAAITGLFSWGSKEEEPTKEENQEGEEKEPVVEGEGEHEEADEEKQESEQIREEETAGMWEETFKSHKDSKPRGPEGITADISFVNFEHVYGIPEHADSFSLKETKGSEPYRLYNLDVFEYELDSRAALYGSIPFLIAHNTQRTVGMLWLNAAETWVDVDKSGNAGMVRKLLGFGDNSNEVSTHWMSESGVIDVFFFMGPNPSDVVDQYTSLTGRPYMPPKWATAYHQSRWNYNDEQDVAQVDENFDLHDIPYDALWLDIEHTDGKRYMTWDSRKFPNPVKMQDDVAAKGRKMITIIDPHIKVDSGYHIYSEAQTLGYFVRNAQGSEFQGWCWPGNSAYLDFTRPEVRDWWANKLSPEQYKGSTLNLFTWNDMNEPSVFNGPEITMHKDVLHDEDWEHRNVHNMYGFYQTLATVDGQLKRSHNNERSFVLTRAFFAGSQRFCAMWTGDNTAEWGHLKASVPMLLSVGISGVTHCGADVGGFFKNPDPELLTRWYQSAIYQPFLRAHAHIDTTRREPWLYEAKYKDIIRSSLRKRYELLPYWYQLFYQSHQKGTPLLRPLWFEFPKDQHTFGIDDEFMVGPALLIHPTVAPSARTVTVYLPGTTFWYDVDSGQRFEGGNSVAVSTPLEKTAVFQRGGSIIPRKMRVRRCSTLMTNDPFTLFVALDKTNSAEGYVYIDDGHSYNFETKNEYIHKHLTFKNNVLQSSNIGGSFDTKSWLERVIITGISQPSQVAVEVDGAKSNLDFVYNESSLQVVIRKPAVNMAKDWKIFLS